MAKVGRPLGRASRGRELALVIRRRKLAPVRPTSARASIGASASEFDLALLLQRFNESFCGLAKVVQKLTRGPAVISSGPPHHTDATDRLRLSEGAIHQRNPASGGGHFRNERDSHAGHDERLHCFDLRCFHDKLKIQVVLLAECPDFICVAARRQKGSHLYI